MNQTLATLALPVDINNRDSIETALNQYAELIASGKAFRHTYCKVFFEFSEKVEWSQYGDQALLKSLLSYHMLNESDLVEFDNHFCSETQLFLIAIEHTELLPTLVKLATVMRDRGRLVNDWYNLFIAESEFFALSSLFSLSWYYPQYGYLLAGFLPAKDKHTSPVVINMMHAYASRNGICEETIKAWCYCDHATIRNTMFIQDAAFDAQALDDELRDGPISPLYHYFSDNGPAFERFQSLLSQRFVEQAYLPFEEHLDPYDSWGQDVEPVQLSVDPVNYFYSSLLAHGIKDHQGIARQIKFDYLTAPALQLANEHTAQIEALLGKSLVETIDPWAGQRANIRYYSIYTAHFEWEELITGHVSNGPALWEYVIKGGDDALLASVPAIALFDTCESTFSLCDLMHSAGIEDETAFNNQLYDLVIDYVDDELDRVHAQKERDKVLRFFDLLFRLTGGRPISEAIKTLLVDGYSIITESDFSQRYGFDFTPNNGLTELHHILELVKEPTAKKLDQAYEIVSRHRGLAHEWYQGLEHIRDEVQFVFSTLIIAKEGVNPAEPDDLYRHCLEFVEKKVVSSLINEMEDKISTNYLRVESRALCDQHWQVLQDYIYGRNNLTAAEVETNMSPFYSPEEESSWLREQKFEAAFCFEHDHYLLTSIWLLSDLALPIQHSLKRILSCILYREPLSIIDALYDFYIPNIDTADDECSEDENERLDADSEKVLLTQVERLGISTVHYYSWLLNEGHFLTRWEQVACLYGLSDQEALTQYIDTAMLGLSQSKRLRFLWQVEESQTAEVQTEQAMLAKKKLEGECLWAIENWLSRSLLRPEHRFYTSLPKEHRLGFYNQAHEMFNDNFKAHHAFMDSLSLDVTLADMHTHLIGEKTYQHKECFIVQKTADDYKILTKPWLVKALRESSPLVNRDDDYFPSLFIVSDSIDSNLLSQLQQDIESRVFEQQIQQVMAYLRGEPILDSIDNIIHGVSFKELDYLPENAESYAVDSLQEYLTPEINKRLMKLINIRHKKGLLNHFFSLLNKR